MRIVSGLDDFKLALERAKKDDQWIAWYQEYYQKYRGAFDPVFGLLMQSQVAELEDVIRNLDFQPLLERAEQFYAEQGIQIIREALQEAENFSGLSFDYPIYLLIGLGYVDATSLPIPEPFMYLGLEHYQSPEQLKYLIPHEYNHLMRYHAIGREEFADFSQLTMKKYIILEGLGTLFPLAMRQKEIHPLSIVDVQMLPQDAGEYCRTHEVELFQEMAGLWDHPVTPELMAQYLVSRTGWKNERPEKIGYYLGTRIIGELLASGHDICALTQMPTEEIFSLWAEVTNR